MTVEQRFLRHVRKGPACWEWVGSKTRAGYGKFGHDHRTRSAHRVAYELWRGPIPDGLCVLHRCDNPACVNPEHLFLGTKSDNSKDMITKRRQVFQRRPDLIPRGERNGSARLTAFKVAEIRALLAAGATKKRVARDIGVSRSLIQFIASRTVWSHVS